MKLLPIVEVISVRKTRFDLRRLLELPQLSDIRVYSKSAECWDV